MYVPNTVKYDVDNHNLGISVTMSEMLCSFTVSVLYVAGRLSVS